MAVGSTGTTSAVAHGHVAVKHHIKPFDKLTVMIDACSYRDNPALGEQFAGLFEALKSKNVQCEVLQDRLGLIEATSTAHPLYLSEDVVNLKKSAHGDGANVSDIPEKIRHYLAATNAMARHVPTTYLESEATSAIIAEQHWLTKRFLFEDPRFVEEWPDKRHRILARTKMAKDHGDYAFSLFITCQKVSHVINALHERMIHEVGFKESLTEQDKKDFMLDQFPDLHKKVYWDHIDLARIDPEHIPLIVVEAFNKTPVILGSEHSPGVLGRRDHLTDMGKAMISTKTNLGEIVMIDHAREILGKNSATEPARHAMLLITDDGGALKDMTVLQKQHPNCTVLTSREFAGMIAALAKGPMKRYFPEDVAVQADAFYRGNGEESMFFADLAPDQIRNDGIKFVDRITISATMPEAMRQKF